MTLTTPGGRPYGHIAQIIPNRLYFGSFHEIPPNDEHTFHFRIDENTHYHPFYADFGPINLAELYRACLFFQGLLKTHTDRCLVICTDADDANRVNGAFLVASYMVIYEGLTADQAYLKVQRAEPPAFIGYSDASLGEPTYLLHLQHAIKAIEKALKFKWLDFDKFDSEEYEYYERVENGDLNWIIPNRIISFCGPHDRSYVHNGWKSGGSKNFIGYPYHAPEVYFDYFRKNNVSTIVRLNTKLYDRNRFLEAGFDHRDLFFIDGSTPSDEIVERFIEIVDAAKGAVAVHCKAGLGRTGTLIACWMMKEYRMTAPQAIAWLRICRPGSVIGPQQQFLIDKQAWCWKLGSQRMRSPKRTLSTRTKKSTTSPTNESTRQTRLITTPNTCDETAINDKGQSQGDRLNEIKVRSQWQSCRRGGKNLTPEISTPPRSQSSSAFQRFPTATTPIKQLKLSSNTAPKNSASSRVLDFKIPSCRRDGSRPSISTNGRVVVVRVHRPNSPNARFPKCHLL